MGKLTLYDKDLPRDHIIREREMRYLDQSPSRKFMELLSLIHLSVQFNNGEPLKKPQGKGIIISKPKK